MAMNHINKIEIDREIATVYDYEGRFLFTCAINARRKAEVKYFGNYATGVTP